MQQVDIAIVGAGMVGLSLAAALEGSGLSVALVSTLPLRQPDTPQWDVRVSAINAANRQALETLGVWCRLNPEKVAAYQHMHVWDKDSFGEIHFDCASMQMPHLGHIVENQALVNALASQVESETVTRVVIARISRILWGSEQSMLMLDNDEVIAARLVVGADGANSFIRQQAQLPITFRDYGHTAIVANIRTEKPHNATARQAFTPTGPLALLPMRDPHSCSIVWSQQTSQANHLLSLDDEAFCQALTAASQSALGVVSLLTARASFPLTMRYAREWVKDGVVLIGDAAHTIHPLAGQGANLGIQDALALASHLKHLQEQGKALSSKRWLRPFERARKNEAAKMIAAMDGFKTLFDGDDPLKKLVRGIGLAAADSLPGVKEKLVAQAMGLR
ncbi:FAD-dependent monooxygenase [Alteromonas sp. CYL-A6]|uniref:FAD-dependent monooxygenase n=1 Tax=Alteromonas nitratireducens TaxID=3390813 RepID=UPI0034AFEA8F